MNMPKTEGTDKFPSTYIFEFPYIYIHKGTKKAVYRWTTTRKYTTRYCKILGLLYSLGLGGEGGQRAGQDIQS